jgi:hypothetical protein
LPLAVLSQIHKTQTTTEDVNSSRPSAIQTGINYTCLLEAPRHQRQGFQRLLFTTNRWINSGTQHGPSKFIHKFDSIQMPSINWIGYRGIELVSIFRCSDRIRTCVHTYIRCRVVPRVRSEEAGPPGSWTKECKREGERYGRQRDGQHRDPTNAVY